MNRWVSRRDFLRVSAAGTAALSSGLLSSCGEAGDTGSGLAQEANLPLEPELYDPTTPWWLQGNYAPIHSEMRREDLEVIGEIPAELADQAADAGARPPQPKDRPAVRTVEPLHRGLERQCEPAALAGLAHPSHSKKGAGH